MKFLHSLYQENPWSFFPLNNHNLANEGVANRLYSWSGVQPANKQPVTIAVCRKHRAACNLNCAKFAHGR
jgi:hypothetical protein